MPARLARMRESPAIHHHASGRERESRGHGSRLSLRSAGMTGKSSMTRFQLIAIRLLLLALVLAAWETLPRNGVVNPMLLPPLTDVLAMLVQTPRPRAGAGGDPGHGGGSDRRLHHRGAARRRDRRADRRIRLRRADLQAAAVLRVQRAEIDLPADVHPDHGHRLPAEGRLRGVLHHVRRDHERDRGGRVGQGRPRAGRALLRRDAACRSSPASTCRA